MQTQFVWTLYIFFDNSFTYKLQKTIFKLEAKLYLRLLNQTKRFSFSDFYLR